MISLMLFFAKYLYVGIIILALLYFFLQKRPNQKMILIFAATNGYLDSLEVAECLPFEQSLYRFLDNNHPSLGQKILERKQLDDGLRDELKKVLSEFKERFLAEREQPVSST